VRAAAGPRSASLALRSGGEWHAGPGERYHPAKGEICLTSSYAARLIEVPEEGIRLEPRADSAIPDQPGEVNLLALAVVLALGAADYEHHPEPRNPQIQTLDALLSGQATMPWRAARAGYGQDAQPYVLCERTGSATWKCRVETLTPEASGG
jgi:hypothetical protein